MRDPVQHHGVGAARYLCNAASRCWGSMISLQCSWARRMWLAMGEEGDMARGRGKKTVVFDGTFGVSGHIGVGGEAVRLKRNWRHGSCSHLLATDI